MIFSPEMTNQLIDIASANTPERLLETNIQELVALYTDFPETKQMAKLAQDIYNNSHKITDVEICKIPDIQLLKWIDTEYSLFRGFEEKIYAPVYSAPFPNCQELIKFSNIILNHRKSRAGKSLEHHLATIFTAVEITGVQQSPTEIHVHLDKLMNAGLSSNANFKSKGFMEAVNVTDFPIHDHKIIPVIRRRW